jgi:hypothetical protein
LNGENKIGVKRDAKKLPKITFFLDSDITYDKLNNDGMPTGEKIPVTQMRELNQVITDSLTDYPRYYVLPNRDGTPMNTSSYDDSLLRSTKKQLHQNLLREIYVFYWHKMRVVSPETLETIAHYMRHSIAQAMESYTKVNIPPYKPTAQIDIVDIIKPTKVNVVEVERKPYFNPAAYAKKYRKGMVNIGGDDEKVDNAVKKERDEKRKVKYTANKVKILLYKNLWSLNNGSVTKPTKKTIDKYKLQKSESGVWSSSMKF